jgi:hypothetical protein
LDPEGIEKTRVGIGLCLRGCVGRRRGAKIPKSRRRDDSEAALNQLGRKIETLVIAATCAVNDKNDVTVSTRDRILHSTARRLHVAAACGDAIARTAKIAVERTVGGRAH